jgi:hypothetical protein
MWILRIRIPNTGSRAGQYVEVSGVPGRHWILAYAKRDDLPPSCGVKQRTDQTGLQQKYTDKNTDTGTVTKSNLRKFKKILELKAGCEDENNTHSLVITEVP